MCYTVGMEYEIIRSKRKTVSIEINSDGEVKVRAPLRMSDIRIRMFVSANAGLIERKRRDMLKRKAERGPVVKFTDSEKNAIKKKAKELILPLLEEYTDIMGISYERVSFRFQKTRWGSCSSKGGLNFNALLALCPEPVIRYVVVHELCHRKYMNHSRRFWEEVAIYMPDYKEYRLWLKKNGEGLIGRL